MSHRREAELKVGMSGPVFLAASYIKFFEMCSYRCVRGRFSLCFGSARVARLLSCHGHRHSLNLMGFTFITILTNACVSLISLDHLKGNLFARKYN